MNRSTILLLLAALLCGRLAWAQAPAASAPSASIAQRVAELDSPDYDTRLRATQALLSDNTVELGTVAHYFEKSNSPEQRHRLIDVAIHHAIRERVVALSDADDNVGAVGFSLHPALTAAFLPDLKTPAVRVSQPRPGFPAYAQILQGDLIVAVDGKPLAASSQGAAITASLITMINAATPGSRIRLSVYRAGAVIPMEVPVVSYGVLTSIYREDNVNPRTGLPREWDLYTQRFSNLSADAPARTGSPRPLDVNAALNALPAWTPPESAGGESLPINRPPPFRSARRSGPQPEAAEELDARDRD